MEINIIVLNYMLDVNYSCCSVTIRKITCCIHHNNFSSFSSCSCDFHGVGVDVVLVGMGLVG